MKKRKKSTKRRKRIRRNRFIVSLLLISAIMLLYSINEESNSIKEENILLKDEIEELPLKKPKEKDIINFLIMGVDTNDLQSSKNSRTDTIMVASLDKENNKVSIISIPRDTRVEISGRKYKDKINHAHVYGGVNLTKEAVEKLLKINIHNFITVDYLIIKKIVDEIGGVEIDVPMDMKYSDPYSDPPLRIDLKKGVQVLNGDEAIQFLRFRKGYTDQDLGRIRAQQEFIKAMLKKMVNPKIIIKIPKLVDISLDYTETDLTKSEIIKYSLYGIKIKPEEIKMGTIPGGSKMINNIWYYEPNYEALNSFIKNRFHN